MADFVFIRKSRNILSSILHVLLNILLGFGSIFITVATGSWILGIILVFVSKWRIWAVRPRFWLLNIKANLVDLIVGTSFVLIAYIAGDTVLLVHWLLAFLYTIWLIWIKPRSSAAFTEIQALAAVFLGTTATTLLAAPYDAILTVLPVFLIGYAASRHIISQSQDDDFRLLTFIMALVAAEIAWLCHSWYIIYTFGNTGIVVPQLALILTLLGYAASRVYRCLNRRDGHLRAKDVAAPVIFAVLTTLIIVIWFSKPLFDI